ncbi:unnamed protein product [Coffea canephora]|uniref:Haloacid dehalogenase-like hydrolase domain-containing protein Sgpp n=1 Tax=Coffea canephora TaxID=49390 RepID=A0A068UM98_COFCA|nr:unnamed protein product [Coffea canephora]
MPTLAGNQVFSSISTDVSKILSHSRPLCKNFSGSCIRLTSVAARARIFSELTSQTLQCKNALSVRDPLEAILFDIDGTLCDSVPIHYYAFREMLQEVGYNGGQPITEEFFIKRMNGLHNDELCHLLFPDWDFDRAMKFMDDKEAMFRRLAPEQLKPVNGLDKLCKWIEERGLKRAAVTNAPKESAELIISMLGLDDFFELIVLGSECERAKPFPDPYLKAVEHLKVAREHAFVVEDSASGVKAGVAAGMPVVAIASRNPEKLLKAAGATLVVTDFEDTNLWGALKELDRNLGC